MTAPDSEELIWQAIAQTNGRLDTLNGRLWAIVIGTCGTAIATIIGLIFK